MLFNILLVLVGTIIALRVLSFLYFAFIYFKTKKYMESNYTPDSRDRAAKAKSEYVY